MAQTSRSGARRTKSTTRGSAKARSSRSSTARSQRSPRSLGRLEKSLDAAEGALKDLRKELGKGGRDLLRDVERTLKDSRKNFRSMSRTVARDIGKVQRAATRGVSPRSGGGARKSTSGRKTDGLALAVHGVAFPLGGLALALRPRLA